MQMVKTDKTDVNSNDDFIFQKPFRLKTWRFDETSILIFAFYLREEK